MEQSLPCVSSWNVSNSLTFTPHLVTQWHMRCLTGHICVTSDICVASPVTYMFPHQWHMRCLTSGICVASLVTYVLPHQWHMRCLTSNIWGAGWGGVPNSAFNKKLGVYSWFGKWNIILIQYILAFLLNSVFDNSYYSLIVKNKAQIRYSITNMALYSLFG